jgi:hypothetical protein
MNHIRRFATLLAVLAGAVLAFAAAAPPALATMTPPDPGGLAVVPPLGVHTRGSRWHARLADHPDRGRSGTGRRRGGGAR